MEALHRLDLQAVLMLQFIGWFMVCFGIGYSLIIIIRMIRGR
jgi:hypothetical protein